MTELFMYNTLQFLIVPLLHTSGDIRVYAQYFSFVNFAVLIFTSP